MIFVSYTHKDKLIVDKISQRLATVFGQENVFYDSWSVQPGDGIIDKMDKGLRDCKLFFFFVSKNSLISNMVKLEWQNAIIKATKDNVRIIPVKLDDCMMPDILLQTLYIDIFGQGLENGIRQIIDVIEGRNTYRRGTQPYENVRGY
ncbi:MAG: toll/interleukin-1 receptor domain-containing protein, partial [Dehalococcoidales bacterium]|nr:toll/interleukin-1 receptor domain-containing protein [Dehalococcoidales bacterium]